MPGAGDLRERIEFSRRGLDADGELTLDWEAAFRVSAQVQYLRGGETVMEQRLQGNQPVIITVRDSRDAQQIETDWRAVNTRTGDIYDIKGAAPAKERGFIDLTAVANGNQG